MQICPKCQSDLINKKGWLKNKKQNYPIRQYQCKDCEHRFSANSIKSTKLQKKPYLNKKIMELYCEGNTLRGIARLVKCSYTTVVRKWRFMAKNARSRHMKALNEKEIVTKYIQFDEMESYEHTKNKPLGIELAIRPKTGQIVSAKVCRIPLKAQSVSPKVKAEYKKKRNRKDAMARMFFEINKCLNQGYSVLSCDGGYEVIHMAKIMCPKSLIATHVNDYASMWRLNHTCAKLRHHISRLKRRTWATTKKMEFLQMHLDLFIAYQNEYDWDMAN